MRGDGALRWTREATTRPSLKGALQIGGNRERWIAKKVPKHAKRYFFVDEQGRADMSYRNTPDSKKPPRALSGPGHDKGSGKGVGKATHAAHAIQDSYVWSW